MVEVKCTGPDCPLCNSGNKPKRRYVVWSKYKQTAIQLSENIMAKIEKVLKEKVGKPWHS